MDIQDYQLFDGEILREKIRSLPRQELDNQINQFGGQYALLCQRLEAVYTPERVELFILIRPGGLEEIDKVIALTGPDRPRELALLKSFRELNRVLLPFMDEYEERVLGDLQYMSKEELDALYVNVEQQLVSAQKLHHADDYRQAQNAGGTLRLATLMKDGIRRELKQRFGFEIR